LLTFLIDEKNPKLVEIYKRKADEYFDRAAYLKKQVLNKNEESQNAGGGANSAMKKK